MRNNYAHEKRLFDFGNAKLRSKLDRELERRVREVFDRAHSLTRKLPFQSEVYDVTDPEIGRSQVRHVIPFV